MPQDYPKRFKASTLEGHARVTMMMITMKKRKAGPEAERKKEAKRRRTVEGFSLKP